MSGSSGCDVSRGCDVSWNTTTPFLVIVNHYDHDVSWAQRLKLPHIVYYKDQPEREPFNARNKAKSETNLLKFISDFYDNLPQNVITVHQYEHKFYHEGSLVDILNDPAFVTKYARTKGYWCFNKAILGSVKEQLPRMLESGWWDACMRPTFGPIENCGDFTMNKIGCAQFVVSRERIHSLPREFYRKMYDWLVENTLDEEPTSYDPKTLWRVNTKNWQHPNSNFYTSRYMEWSWELIFTSCKDHEKIKQTLPDGRKLAVTYGYGSYRRDVTAEFIKRFCRMNIGSCRCSTVQLQPVNLNECFGDHVPGCAKTLLIHIDQRCIEIAENWSMIMHKSLGSESLGP